MAVTSSAFGEFHIRYIPIEVVVVEYCCCNTLDGKKTNIGGEDEVGRENLFPKEYFQPKNVKKKKKKMHFLKLYSLWVYDSARPGMVIRICYII